MDQSPPNLHQQAITAALSSNWEEALKLNQEIIATDPDNIDALNRVARAYFELGDLAESKKHYERAFKKDPYNQIAQKFLKRIETFSKKGVVMHSNNHNHHTQFSTDLFIEEPGKTKLVTLLKIAEPQKLSLLSPGTFVNLIAKNRGVTVADQDNEYLGVLPDDVSHRLLRLMKGGNKYQALIKTVKTNSISILIREIFRSSRFKNQPSFFDASANTITYSSDHIILPSESEEDPPDQLYDGEDESA